MGCDIHIHSEVKIKGKWEHYSAIETPRSYALFSKMANVRNFGNVQPISEARGIPEDCSIITKICKDRWSTDGHSHSYLSFKEICTLYKWIKDNKDSIGMNWPWSYFGYFFGDDYTSFQNEDYSFPKEIEDVRFVFWFDN